MHQISSGRGNAKNALIAEFDIGGNRIAFFSIHKDKDLRDGTSFKKLRSAIDDSDVPTVLIGDFNVESHDGRFELLGSEFLDTALAVDSFSAKEARTLGTWGDGLGYRIDYVLVRPTEFQVVDAGIVGPEHREASDHYAYYAKFKLKRRLSNHESRTARERSNPRN